MGDAMQGEQIQETVRKFILKQYLPERDPDILDASTALMTSGILDSLSVLEVVSFLEDTYGIKVAASEVNLNSMSTLTSIADFVQGKRDCE